MKKYGKYIKITDEVLRYIEKILHKNLMWGTILSKFYGWTRGVFPFMAGALNISFPKILLSSGISNLLWGTGFFLLGYLLGESYEIVAQHLGAFITRGIVAGIVIAILFRYFKSEYHIFKSGFSLLMIGDILSVILFSLITQRIYGNKLSFHRLDTRIQNNIIDSPVIDQIMLWIDKIFGFWFIGLIGLIIIVYLYRKKLMYYLTVFVSSMLSTLLVFPIIKLLIQRTRPDTALVLLNDFSFPSGHAAVSLVVCLLLRYIVQGQLTAKRMRHTLLAVMICCSLVIGMNRIVLDVHRFTDVLGGFLLGFFILTTNILVWKIFFKTHIEQQKVLRKKSKKQLIDVLIVDN
ncbi:MAG: phosphatase PAP2 family protein [Candidatus Peribacteria bacterium]|nr:phosphatase PAP2 family protein [Candidatus Peribacteria bacterium]